VILIREGKLTHQLEGKGFLREPAYGGAGHLLGDGFFKNASLREDEP